MALCEKPIGIFAWLQQRSREIDIASYISRYSLAFFAAQITNMMSDIPVFQGLNELFLQHVAASFDKQIYLEAVLRQARWSFSLDEGVLALQLPHEVLQLTVQILGTESAVDRTWLWAWANAGSGIQPYLLKSAEQLRHLGIEAGIVELHTPDLPVSAHVNVVTLNAIASGVCRAGCSFTVPYPGGVLSMLIKDTRYKRSIMHPLPRIARVFPLLLQQQPVSNHREAYINYLKFYRLKIEEQGGQVTAVMGFRPRAASAVPANGVLDMMTSAPVLLEPYTNQKLVAEFDAHDQLLTLHELIE